MRNSSTAAALGLLLGAACAPRLAAGPARPPRLAAATLAGEPVDLGGPGPVRLVEVFATWCAPCRAAAPAVRAVLARHPEVAGWSLSIDDDLEALATEAARAPPPGRLVVHAGGLAGAARRGLDRIPLFLVLDARGRLVAEVMGYSPGLGARLERAIRDAQGATGPGP
jgi:thiol-disulfide isomerase/thioredoxin